MVNSLSHTWSSTQCETLLHFQYLSLPQEFCLLTTMSSLSSLFTQPFHDDLSLVWLKKKKPLVQWLVLHYIFPCPHFVPLFNSTLGDSLKSLVFPSFHLHWLANKWWFTFSGLWSSHTVVKSQAPGQIPSSRGFFALLWHPLTDLGSRYSLKSQVRPQSSSHSSNL